ncbi:MAG: hypothetical protein LUP94_02750 [Candidatus Methanomethylicus sp.]|nr:hypothetical protein [Candidatus Methanomethylicus sp.]
MGIVAYQILGVSQFLDMGDRKSGDALLLKGSKNIFIFLVAVIIVGALG